MSHKEGLILPGLWAIIPTLLSIFLFQGKSLVEFAELPDRHHSYAMHPPVLVCLNWLVLILVPDIDLRFPPNVFFSSFNQ